jgi:diguanylate cyclase (GGDEF)-like protein
MTSAVAARWSLRHELSRMLILAALVPVLVFSVALVVTEWRRDRDDLLLRLAVGAQSSQDAFDDFLEAHQSSLRLLAGSLGSPGSPAAAGDLERLMQAYPAFLRAVVTDERGMIVQSRGGQEEAESRDQDVGWFPVEGDAVAPAPYRVSVHGDRALITLSAPMVRDGRAQGAMRGWIPVERLVRQRVETLSRRGLELLLIDADGRAVHATSGLRWRHLEATGPLGMVIRDAAVPPGTVAAKGRSLRGLLRDGDDGYVTAVRMRNGWVVAIVAPEQRLMELVLPRLGLLLGLGVVTTLGVLFALWRMRKLLITSMGNLVGSLRGYALGGELDPGQLARMPEELQPLAGGIGDLAARMNTAFLDLRLVLDEREHVIAERTESLRQAVSDLDRLSRTDALTGSLNYRGFLETAEALWRDARAAGRPLAVLALDIDHFKRYNDHYGHAAGDAALRRFAGAVRSALLHADDVLARPGGEEFIVFLPGGTQEQAMLVGQRVCERVRGADIVHAASSEGRMTVSVGIASVQPDDDEAEQMLRRADAALYRAKAAGRNRVSD